MIHRRVHPAIDRRVGDCRDPIQVLQRMEVLAGAVPVDDQVVDDGVSAAATDSRRSSSLRRQTGQIGDREAASNGRNCARAARLERYVDSTGAADDEDVLEIRLQLGGQRERAAEIQLRDHAGRIRQTAVHARAIGKEDDRRVRKQLVPILLDELERERRPIAMTRSNRWSLVLQPQEITEAGLVIGIGKSRLVDEFRVVVEAVRQGPLEDPRQLALTDDDDLRVPPCRSTGRAPASDRVCASA